MEKFDKKAVAAEHDARAAELAKIAKIKAEREHRAKIEAECKRLQIPRLLAIKGVRRLRPVVVLCDATSLSRRDHFLLETENCLYHYKGEFAPFTTQRTKAVERTQQALQAERMVPLKLISVPPDKSDPKDFWEVLKGSKFSVTEGMGDNVWELKYNEAFKFYRFDAEVGLMQEDDVSCKKLEKKSIFVVAAPGELYVWYGKETGLLRRNQAKALALQVYKTKKEGATSSFNNSWVQIREIHQGSEDYLFRQKFPDWVEMSATGVPLDPHVLLEIFSRKMLEFNPAKVTQITDVDGQLDIWVAKDHGKVPIAKMSYGEFFNGNSYIVLYQGRQGRVVYFWQGTLSHVSWEHAADSIKAVQRIALSGVDLLKRKKTTIPVVRVSEGDEPAHLLALFNGAFIVRQGKFDSFEQRLILMYHVRGTDPFNCRVVESALSRKALRSEDAFLAYSPKIMFVWRGKNCNEFAYRVALAISQRYRAVDSVEVVEGQEKQEFWDMLGGKMEMKEMEKKRVKGRKCQKCSQGNPVDVKFCRKCGAPMVDKRRESQATGQQQQQQQNLSSSGEQPPVLTLSTSTASLAVSSSTHAAEDLSKLVPGEKPKKKGRRCTKCSKVNPPTNGFCRRCGSELTGKVENVSDTSQSESDAETKPSRRDSTRGRRKTISGGVKCSSCNKSNAPGMKFCKYCGTTLLSGGPETSAKASASSPMLNTAMAEEQSKAESKPAEVVAPPPAEPTPPAGGVNVCGSCGSDNDANDKFCQSCGSPLRLTSAPALVRQDTPIPVQEPVVQEIKCAGCGTWNEPGCKFCADCGDPLQVAGAAATPAAAASSSSAKPSAAPAGAGGADDGDDTGGGAMKTVKCSKCFRPNDANQKFCKKCGGFLRSKKGSVISLDGNNNSTNNTNAPSDTESDSEGQKEQKARCKQCGFSNPAENIFCKKCGTRFAAPKLKPSEEIAKLKRANSTYLAPPTKAAAKERGVRCQDPNCAKPNKPGDAECRVCGKPLPKLDAAPVPSPKPAAKKAPPKLEKTDSSAFLKKADKNALESQVGDWLKRRDLGGSVDGISVMLKPTGAAEKLAMLQAKQAAEKAAAEAKAAEERKRKEEEEALAEARRWVMPKLFIIQGGNIHAKRAVLQTHLSNPETQAIIDNKDIMWVWIGAKSNADQGTFARDLAKFYCDIVWKESQRKAVMKDAKQGEEPPEFIKLFQGWAYADDAQPKRQMSLAPAVLGLAQQSQPVAAAQPGAPAAATTVAVAPATDTTTTTPTPTPTTTDAAVAPAAATPAATTVEPPKPGEKNGSSASLPNAKLPESGLVGVKQPGNAQAVLGMYMAYLPLERLQNPATLPPTLNMSSLETYLTDEDFAAVFKMSRSDFAKLPAWKKVQLKKDAKLF